MSQGFEYFMVFLSQSTGQRGKDTNTAKNVSYQLSSKAMACFYSHTHHFQQN